MRGSLALIQRLRLLADRRLRFDRGGGLLLGGASDEFGSLLRFLNGSLAFNAGGDGLLAAVGKLDHVAPKSGQDLDDCLSGLGLSDGRRSGRLDRGGGVPNTGLDFFGQALYLEGAFVGSLG